VRVARWAAVWLTALLLATMPGVGALAQYDDGLPAGVTQITVDGQPIDASTTPQVATRSPVFAGRLGRGATEVELALGNGEIVRFAVEVNPENGRFRANPPEPLDPGTYALYVNDALVGNFVVAENAAGGARADGAADAAGATIDLARMVPYPFDLDEAYPGLGLVVQDPNWSNRYYDALEQARRQTSGAGETSRQAVQELRRQYEAAGFRGLYEIRLASPAEDNRNVFSVQVNGAAIEYDSAENAAAEYQATVENRLPREGGEAVPDAATIGDASQVFRSSGVATSTGIAYRLATLVFLRDRVIVRVDVADFRNREPEQSTIEELGAVLLDQVEGVLAEESVPLSTRVLDLDLQAIGGPVEIEQAYEAVDGNLIPRYLEEQASLEARAAALVGATNVYSSTATAAIAAPGFQGDEGTGQGGDREERRRERQRQRAERAARAEGTPRAERPNRTERAATPEAATAGEVEPGATPSAGAVGDGTVLYGVTLYAFPGEAEAEAWLAGLPERLDEDPLPGYLRFAPLDDAPSLGEGSRAYAFDRREGDATVSGVRYYGRQGAEVAAIELAAPVEPSLEAMQELVEAQLACLDAGVCAEPAPLPFDAAADQAG